MRMVGALTDRGSTPFHTGSVRIIIVGAMLLSSAVASADLAVDHVWPAVPAGHEISMEDQLTSRIDEWSNQMGRHLDNMSHDMVALRFDAFHNHAHMRVGGGDEHYLSLHIDGDFVFHDGLADVNARVDLAIHGHSMQLELPNFEMVPSSYGDNRYVEIRVPFFKRRF
jgi:hypothetical protein